MPEGDTIFKVAERLRPGLCGRVLERVELHGRPAASLGREVLSVEPVGKHLVIELQGGEFIRIHLGMHGSWHRYRPSEQWRRPRTQASLKFDAGARTFVCFNAMKVDFLEAAQVNRLRRSLKLDLLGRDFDGGSIVRRVRQIRTPESLIVDVLLDQRPAAGIGNVYKNEVLFLERVHPLAPLGDMSDSQVEALYRRAYELLHENLGTGPRRTRPGRGARHFVYGRGDQGQPCFECGTKLRYDRLGRFRRGTHWCPSCQPLARRAGGETHGENTA